jgi:NADPH-dependent ferric siderophore reductase
LVQEITPRPRTELIWVVTVVGDDSAAGGAAWVAGERRMVKVVRRRARVRVRAVR